MPNGTAGADPAMQLPLGDQARAIQKPSIASSSTSGDAAALVPDTGLPSHARGSNTAGATEILSEDDFAS
jgi:hypothetical protein